MATSFYPQEEEWYGNEWATVDEYDELFAPSGPPMDIIVLGAAVVVIVFLVLGLGRLVGSSGKVAAPSPSSDQEQAPAPPAARAAPPLEMGTADAFVMPYTDYILTQGPHGLSYGHYAIDLAAGKGEPVLSPINGRVSELYVDGVGNPTLVIENERYIVTMLHGDYTAELGQEVAIGEQLGTESNRGNTRDMAGNSCRNRDCGYHTHLNVYDKQASQNVNPLDLLDRRRGN